MIPAHLRPSIQGQFTVRWQVRRTVAAAILIGAAAVAALAVTGCAGDTGKQTRVVSVSKQINEFIYAIGAQGDLVGRDLTSIYPPAIARVPSVGYHRALSAEGIISLRPTLLLTDGNVGPDGVLEQLKRVGIPVLVMPPGESVDSAQMLMTRLGKLFHRERSADSVLSIWRSGMDSTWRDTARSPASGGRAVASEAATDTGGARTLARARPRVLVMHFGQLINNYLGVGAGGPADRMIRWAGGTNVIDSTAPMTWLTPELIARLAPDVIVATDVGFDRVGSAARFRTLPGVSLTPAGRDGRVYRLDETEILYFGPRTPATIERLASMFRSTGLGAPAHQR